MRLHTCAIIISIRLGKMMLPPMCFFSQIYKMMMKQNTRRRDQIFLLIPRQIYFPIRWSCRARNYLFKNKTPPSGWWHNPSVKIKNFIYFLFSHTTTTRYYDGSTSTEMSEQEWTSTKRRKVTAEGRMFRSISREEEREWKQTVKRRTKKNEDREREERLLKRIKAANELDSAKISQPTD